VNEIQEVYQSQGVYIADKHVEIIVRQMTTRVIILHPGSTGLLSGDMIDMYRAQHLSLVDPQLKFRPVLLGITRAALTAETKRVLANAAINGQIDWLTGLKENVILGRLIPAGTGLY
jgi:DNA-directed RNA polymerase subunit beta'